MKSLAVSILKCWCVMRHVALPPSHKIQKRGLVSNLAMLISYHPPRVNVVKKHDDLLSPCPYPIDSLRAEISGQREVEQVLIFCHDN